VPEPFASLFRGYGKILRSHRGYDIGAPVLADLLAVRFGVAAHLSTVTRLLVDLNRSARNPRRFSEISRRLTPRQKDAVMEEYYHPYRRKIESEIGRLCSRGKGILHLSVHTFTPVLEGRMRFADIGLLYDPSRRREALFCRKWKLAFRVEDPTLKVRLNYPYSGKSDGFTTHLRALFGAEVYLGIEIEVNQKFALGEGNRWLGVQRIILDSITSTLDGI
jgi:predicted N-formylglutamate amidohydrolase